MSILALARRRSSPDTTPYPMPTGSPWNAPAYAVTPTPDGSGSAVHPSVVDMGPSRWNGHRYWMAVTPYLDSNSSKENPNILCSSDGYTWRTPAGLANPIAPPPGAPSYGYNSDTDLVWDADNGRMVCYWRESSGAGTETIYASTSTSGNLWSTPILQYQTVSLDKVLSPSVVPLGGGDWAMFFIDDSADALMRASAASPLGPWGGPTVCTLDAVVDPWHVGVRNVDGVLYAILNQRGPWGLRAATSSDGGATWSVGGSPFMVAAADSWDNGTLYRAQFQPHENGTHFRVWYSADSTTVSWRVGYTQVPRSLWPTPA